MSEIYDEELYHLLYFKGLWTDPNRTRDAPGKAIGANAKERVAEALAAHGLSRDHPP